MPDRKLTPAGREYLTVAEIGDSLGAPMFRPPFAAQWPIRMGVTFSSQTKKIPGVGFLETPVRNPGGNNLHVTAGEELVRPEAGTA